MTLSLAEKVAQMVVVRASGFLFDHQIRYPLWEPPVHRLQHWLQDLGVGGVILVDGSAMELAIRTQLLQSWAKFPLLVAADVEEGVGQRFAGATWLPPMMAIGALANQSLEQAELYAEKIGEIIAQEALIVGLNWILAPVVDVNNNPKNPVINVRSFGETPERVSRLATALIRGCQRYPVLTAAKHFPGHGDTAIDSHIELPSIPHPDERLTEIELPPFVASMKSGVDAVMMAHLLIPAWDAERPATLSPAIVQGQLRQRLGFEGLVVTDALVMGAIAKRYSQEEAAILAVEAGADILLMPLDPQVTIEAVCGAVAEGRIPRERIEASVNRIWRAKAKVFPNWRPSEPYIPTQRDPKIVFDSLSQPSSQETVTTILQQSLKQGGNLPLVIPETPQPLQNLVIVDDLLNCAILGNHTPAIARPTQLGYRLQLVDCHAVVSSGSEKDSLLRISSDPTLLQVFIRANAFRDSSGLTQIAEHCLNILLRQNQLQALVIYGSPYTLEQFLPLIPPTTPFVFSYGQTPTAQEIALKVLWGI